MTHSPRPPLTRQQQRVLQAVRAQIAASGLPPTQAELARTLGFASLTAAKDHLKALERKGYLQLRTGTARGIRLCEPAPELDPAAEGEGLPLVGRVAAGSPLLAVEHIERHVAVGPDLFSPAPDYLLRVAGESMRDAGILDGDLLAVRRSNEARNGQIVVARIEDEVTVKRFRRDGRHVQLIAENPDFAPIVIDLAEQPLAIEGLAVGVLRQLDAA